MTNYEKYKDEIEYIWKDRLTGFGLQNNEIKSCIDISCDGCAFFEGDDDCCDPNSQKWLVSECKDPAEDVDWSKVPVDTPVLVKHHENDSWAKAYFAKTDRNEVCTFKNGTTSWTNKEETFGGEKGRWLDMWEYAKLADPDDLKKSEFYQEKREYGDEELIDMLVTNYVEKADDDIYFSRKNYKEFLESIYWFWKANMNNFNKEKIVKAVKLMLEVE